MNAAHLARMQRAKRDADARRRAEGARRVRAFRSWLATCDPSAPIAGQLARMPTLPRDADYRAARDG